MLAGASRIVEASSEALLKCSEENTSSVYEDKHSLLISGFYIGNHTITAEVELAQELKTASVSFIGIPIKFLVAIISTVAMLLISLRVMKKNDIKVQ